MAGGDINQVQAFINGICFPRRKESSVTNPTLDLPLTVDSGDLTTEGLHQLVPIPATAANPATFISAVVSKRGGATDRTFVKLEIDGKVVVYTSFATARIMGLNKDNPYGVVFHQGSNEVQTITIGFQQPLYFTQGLDLSVVVQEELVQKVVGTVIYGQETDAEGGAPNPPEGIFP